ncbi:MAG: cupredoxin domain-containing protein [Haloarculaceae archaeon]
MKFTRRTLIGAVSAGLAIGVAGCNSNGDSGSNVSIEQTTSVTMTENQFDPRNIHVDTGATVTWTNEDSSAHTVTSGSDNWRKNTEVAADDETTHTFEQDGVYDAYCQFHGSDDLSGMSMKIGVGDDTISDPLGENDSTAGGISY